MIPDDEPTVEAVVLRGGRLLVDRGPIDVGIDPSSPTYFQAVRVSKAAAEWFQRTGIRPWTIVEVEEGRFRSDDLPAPLNPIDNPDLWTEEAQSRICIWCGQVCESVEDLARHEEDCQ